MKEEILKIKADWHIPYTHTAGVHGTRFLKGLQEKKIFGVKCEKCGRVIVPPRPFCERCFVKLERFVEVKDEGTVVSFTINYMKYTGLPEPPYAIGLILLDGADTPFIHRLGGVDLSDPVRAEKKIGIGKRVKAVWSDERKASIDDILYFAPSR